MIDRAARRRERTLFRRLGIFVSGLTLNGAVAVGNGEELSLRPVGILGFKSLVLFNRRATRCVTSCSKRRAPMPWKIRLRGRAGYACRPPPALSARPLSQLEDRWRQTAQRSDIVAALQTELTLRSALDDALTRSVILGAELLANTGANAWRAIGLDAEGMIRCEVYLAALPAISRGCELGC